MEEFKDEAEYKVTQTEWALLNLIREVRGISTKGAMPTYYNSIKLAQQLAPDIFNEKSVIVKRHHEPELARAFRQQAEAQSALEKREVAPLEMVDKRISELNNFLSSGIDQKDLIDKELGKLRAVRSLFLPKNVSEDFILSHDVKSFKFGVEPIAIATKHSDYQVAENRIIRVRLIHPDQGEQKMGADLIYEQYDHENKKVRFVMAQYKIWDGTLLYWSQARNLDAQLKKMHDNLCSNKYCLSEAGLLATGEFRYPYCAAFLRPTDKLQYKDSPFSSSGMHIPICQINSVVTESKDGNKILEKSKMRSSSISQKVFEDGFNYNQVGSRWMTYDEAEELYLKHRILEDGEKIILHVQELEV
ncbi:hypothetical protein [uncultured Imperialibacter sp.]|uniref:hypothetical protein n=1 Tax=uncultured Imperialibacter sp. TaxID=1672639 RepID=UPI0030DAAB5A|tara:strand:- start:1358 stop:2437 length:1080 start_codon:yes stop_codon:yes gene_type:complete